MGATTTEELVEEVGGVSWLTVAVLVEEAEGLLELGDLVVGELVRHGLRSSLSERRAGARERTNGGGLAGEIRQAGGWGGRPEAGSDLRPRAGEFYRDLYAHAPRRLRSAVHALRDCFQRLSYPTWHA